MGVWLSFRDVEYVAMVAKYGNITLAAQNLHISQPALSIYLGKLEERLGTPLFDRIGKKIQPTYAGQCVLEGGAEILRLRNDLHLKLDEIVYGGKGQLRVGLPYIRGITMLPPVLKEYKRMHPGVEVIVCEDNPPALQKKLCEGELEVAFFSRVLDDPSIEWEEILSDPIVLYLPGDSPLLGQAVRREGFAYPWIDLSLCKEMEFVLNYPSQRTYEISMQVFRDHGFAPKIAVQVQNQLTAIHLAGTGCGLYLAPAYFSFNVSFVREDRPVMLSVGKTGPYMMEFVAAWRRGLYPSRLVVDFVRATKRVYAYNPPVENSFNL